jgi:hypothetical protein
VGDGIDVVQGVVVTPGRVDHMCATAAKSLRNLGPGFKEFGDILLLYFLRSGVEKEDVR